MQPTLVFQVGGWGDKYSGGGQGRKGHDYWDKGGAGPKRRVTGESMMRNRVGTFVGILAKGL